MTDLHAMKREIEGGDNMRDLSELHASELGEIVWQHRSGATDIYIAKRLRAKLWQVKNYIRDVEQRFSANNIISQSHELSARKS